MHRSSDYGVSFLAAPNESCFTQQNPISKPYKGYVCMHFIWEFLL